MADTTNCPKDNLVKEETEKAMFRRGSKKLSARQYQVQEAPVGPSSKSIETLEVPLNQTVQNTGVEEFPISKVLKEEKVPSSVEESVQEPVVAPK